MSEREREAGVGKYLLRNKTRQTAVNPCPRDTNRFGPARCVPQTDQDWGRGPPSSLHLVSTSRGWVTMSCPPFTCVHTGMAQSYPVHCGGQAHVSGAAHHPPFRHSTLHTGTRQSSPSSTLSLPNPGTAAPPPPAHSDAHEHAPGAVQFPPFPHVCGHTGTVQLGPNQPCAQEHASGAVQRPPCSHVCTQRASRQSGAPV